MSIFTAIKDRLFPVKTETIKDYPMAYPNQNSPRYPSAFSTDGCSGGMSKGWRKFFGGPPPWEHCCVKHDFAYWRGGFWKDRLKADQEMFRCIKENGHPVWAVIMYLSVRIGGSPIWPVSWRWGYGWKYTGRYEKRSQTEKITTSSSEDQ